MLLAVRISSYGCTWEVWRALKKLELLSAAPRATLTHLSCSPNFPCASITRYTHAKQILKFSTGTFILSEQVQPMDTSSSSLQARIAILYRDQSDIASIEDVFGDIFRCVSSITEKNPHTMKERLLSSSVRSCFIIVESLKMKEELLKKSNGTLYQDLLRAASMKVGKNVFPPSSSGKRLFSHNYPWHWGGSQ